ncbi:MAG: hypothetical protein RJA57_1 [Bacteroidota bacterium]|jgi:hypothetical protein
MDCGTGRIFERESLRYIKNTTTMARSKTLLAIIWLVILQSTAASAQKSSNKTPTAVEVLQYATTVQSGLKPMAQPVTAGSRVDLEMVNVRLREGRRIVEDALLAGEQMTESQAADFHRRMEMVSSDLVGLTSRDRGNRCASSCYKNYAKGGPSRIWNMFTCLAICLGQ